MQRIAVFMGPDFYDPCPASRGRIGENGLSVPWRGSVYMNPPYGAAIAPWIRKATLEPVRELIALVPAYTDTRWFAPLWEWPAICFIRGRIQFVGLNGIGEHAPHPSVLAYRGRRWRQFAAAFADLGPIARTAVAHHPIQPQLLTEQRSA